MHAGCNIQSYGSDEHNHALVAFLTCILGRYGACKHLGCSEHAASGRRDPVGVASRNRLHGGIRAALSGCKHKRAFFTAAKHNETTQTCQKSNIYTIAKIIPPEYHTRGGSSCYGAHERSTSQRAGAPFLYAEGLTGLPKLLRLSYWSVVGRIESNRIESNRIESNR